MDHDLIYNDWLSHHSRYRGARLALVDDSKEVSLTYRELERRVDALGGALQARHGIRFGDRVALVSKSCSEAFELQFACARIGAIFVPINWRLSAEELQWILADCDPGVTFYDAGFGHLVPPDCPSVPIDARASKESAYERLTQCDRPAVPCRVDAEAIWMIVYTSGTTGRPKGAMLSFRMIHANVMCWLSPARIGHRSVFLCSMPTFHTGGLHCYSSAVLYAGGTVIVQRDYEPARALALMADDSLRVTHFFGTPTHYAWLTQCPAYAPGALKYLEVAGLGGAPCANALIEQLLDDGVPLQPAYGMSEIGPAIFVTELDAARRKLGSCGHPTLHVEMKVVDANGASCAEGTVGELWVRGPLTMSGYWRNADATRSAFEDGWFKTGDGVLVDEDGYVHVVDRLKAMFISGGENIYPAEIERVLGDHPAVLLSAVIGVDDAHWGEVGAAFVVLKSGATATAAELLEFCGSRIARFKVPKTLTLMPDLPRNASGKILKRALARPLSH